MSYRPFFSWASIAIAALVLLLWSAAVQLPMPSQPEPLRVAVGMWAGTEPWIMAREAGDLDSRDIRLVEINWTSAAMRAVGNRVVDAAVLSLDEVIRQVQQGYPLKVVLVMDISRGADLIIAKSQFDSVNDLKGGRIGYEPRTSGSWLLSKALENSNLKLADVQPVPLNPAEVEEIFGELNLDGVVLTEPWSQRMNAFNLNRVYDSSRPGATVVRVLAVHPDALATDRESLLNLIKAHFKWLPELKKGGPALQPVLRREGVSQEVFEDILTHVESVDLKTNLNMLNGTDAWLTGFFAELQTVVTEGAGEAAPVNAADIFEPSLVEVLQ